MGVTDPTMLYRLREGVYAPDLLIVAIAELDLFTVLHEHDALDGQRLCEELELDARAADVMVTYLAALGLLERGDSGQIRASQIAVDHLIGGSPHDLRAYFAGLRERPACAELLQVLRSGEPAAWASASAGRDWAGRLEDVEFARSVTAAMDARGAFLGPALAAAVADIPARRVLDVGGSSGVYACALLDADPQLRATVFERAPVDQVARTLLADRGYSDRVEVITGDMFTNPLPMGHDLHLFSHVLHDWGEEQVHQLLSASFASLVPGGWLIDHDKHINQTKTGPLPVAEYSVLLMHSTPGKCWSLGELGAILEEIGFVEIDCRATAADRTALVARRPA
jgi:predicted O-methyltransferase YrrM